jgi:Ni/Fe-hydrogenase subunit HybB-like protein
MKKVLIFAACAEIVTGLALLLVPSLVGRLLLGAELTGIAIPVARVTGIALIALGIACWPGPPLLGMLTYSAVVALYLAYLGFAGDFTGAFLWPAVILHIILTVLLIAASARGEENASIYLNCPGLTRHKKTSERADRSCE